MLRVDFLKKLIGITLIGKLPLTETEQFRKIYLLQFFTAGFGYYEGPKNLNKMKAGDILELVREPNNAYDDCAIALHWNKLKIGFIPADTNQMLSHLLDTDALSLFGTITHLEQKAKNWESVAVAIYFLQNTNKNLPAHANHLTRIEAPHYRTLGNRNKKEVTVAGFEDLFDNTNRVVNLDRLKESNKAAYKFFLQYPKIDLSQKGNYVHVKDDGIYTYLYDIAEEINILSNNKKEKYLEFFIQ